MTEKQGSEPSQQVNEVKKTVTCEALENGITFKVELRPGHNRLIVRINEEFVFSS